MRLRGKFSVKNNRLKQYIDFLFTANCTAQVENHVHSYSWKILDKQYDLQVWDVDVLKFLDISILFIGIGKEVAKELAKRDSRVIMACRDVIKGEKAAESIRQELKEDSQANVIVKKLNLASSKSIKEFTDEITSSEPKVDILINNAGVFGPPFALTEDGIETTFATNHLGHFLLTNLLLKKLESSMPSKIIVVSSKLYEKAKINFENLNGEQGYKGVAAYAQSKLANLLFAYELNKRLPDGKNLHGNIFNVLPSVRHSQGATSFVDRQGSVNSSTHI